MTPPDLVVALSRSDGSAPATVRLGRRLLHEDAFDRLLTILEDARELPAHQRMHDAPELPEGKGIAHLVLDDRRVALLAKAVGMHPHRVRTAQLRIRKLV